MSLSTTDYFKARTKNIPVTSSYITIKFGGSKFLFKSFDRRNIIVLKYSLYQLNDSYNTMQWNTTFIFLLLIHYFSDIIFQLLHPQM